MDRDRVVDLRADAAVAEILPQVIAPATGHADRVRVKDVPPRFRGDLRDDHTDVAQPLVVHPSELSPTVVPLLELAELDAEDRRLDLVESRVVSDDGVVIAGGLAVLPQGPQLLREAVVTRGQAPGFAVRAQILRTVEGEAVHTPSGAGLASIVEQRAVCLRRVVDDRDVAV